MSYTFGPPITHQKTFKQTPLPKECVYNLVSKPELRSEKAPRYKSVYSESVKAFYESQKVPHKTMGCYRTQLPSPKNYLKKHTRDLMALDMQKKKKEIVAEVCPEHLEKGHKKPPVPRHNERPPMASSPAKNFIKENIRNVSRAAAKKPVPRLADTKKGDLMLMEFSGLTPKYAMKKEFGKTPKYLLSRQEDMEYSRRRYEEYFKDQCERNAPKKLPEKDRLDVIMGLKKNWDSLNREYASLPLFTDTIRKKAHKEQIEEMLRNLERDIDLMEKIDEIYVFDHFAAAGDGA